MKILAFDTSNDGLSVALLENENVIELIEMLENGKQTELLVVTIEKILRNNNIWYDDLDLIATTKGPGSFTGIRVGLSCAKALQIATNLPLIALDSLLVIAHQHRHQNGKILAAIDAKMNEFFVAEFLSENGKITQLSESKLMSTEDFEREAQKKDHQTCGNARTNDKITQLSESKLMRAEDFEREAQKKDHQTCGNARTNDKITADLIGKIAYEKFKHEGESSSTPMYLRSPKISERKKNA